MAKIGIARRESLLNGQRAAYRRRVGIRGIWRLALAAALDENLSAAS